MLPIFNEYIQYMTDTTGVDVRTRYGLKEGCYWINNQCIKAFDKNGELHKIFRFNTTQELTNYITDYKNVKSFEPESWLETAERYKHTLQSKEDESISVIREFIKQYPLHKQVVLTSMGKDSVITRHLVEKCSGEAEIVFNNTSLDSAETYKQAKQDKNVKILNPKEGFYQWQKRVNIIPSRLNRACCSIFKEGETINYYSKDESILFFLGMRADESSKRAEYTYAWRNHKWGNRDWQGCLPIIYWNDLDVWLYIIANNIDINEKYKKGYNRVGCAVACPNYTKTTWVLDKYWYPKAFKRWHDILDSDFTINNKDIIMNCTQEEYHTCWNGGSFRKEATDEVVELFAERNGLNKDVAEKFFNHSCVECDKRIKSKEIIGMNLKLTGRNTNELYCKKHLMQKHEIDKAKWDELVKSFKDDKCELF